MAKILVYGNPNSPLVRQRGLVGQYAGHEIFWFSPEEADLPNVEAYGLPRFAKDNLLFRSILEPFYLQQAIRRIQPDLIHVHYASKGLGAIPLSRFHPLVVSTMGGDIMPDQSYHGIYAQFTKLLLDRADCVTTKSDFMDQVLGEIGDYEDKLQRVNWGIDLEMFYPNRDVSRLRQTLHIPEHDFVFFDSRIARSLYNKHIILEAFVEFLQINNNAVLLVAEMAADTKYLSQIYRRVSDLGIQEKVRFVGTIAYPQMADFYNLADVVVSMPSSDGLPQTIYEAFACGCFVIMGNLPQYQGILRDRENARLVEIGNIQALSKAMLWARKNQEILKNAIHVNYRYVRENADREQQAKHVNNIYQALLEGTFLGNL